MGHVIGTGFSRLWRLLAPTGSPRLQRQEACRVYWANMGHLASVSGFLTVFSSARSCSSIWLTSKDRGRGLTDFLTFLRCGHARMLVSILSIFTHTSLPYMHSYMLQTDFLVSQIHKVSEDPFRFRRDCDEADRGGEPTNCPAPSRGGGCQ